MLRKFRSYWQNKRHYDRFLIITSLVYLGVVGFVLILHHSPYAPDQFFALALIFVLFTGQVKEFVRDWTPPILLLLGYEYLRSAIPKINPVVHYLPMIRFDAAVFGRLPSVALQSALFNPAYLRWYDYFAAFLYSAHFAIALFVAFVFWTGDRGHFESYIFGMVGLSWAAFLTYLAFPAAPPWLAAIHGFTPPIAHITDIVFSHFFTFISLPTVYKYLGANLVAAVPSLHAAYPFFTALFIGKKHPRLIPLLAFYALSIAFAVVYLGEHYFFDVLIGLLYAYLAYAAVIHWHAIKARFSRVKP
jgi:membrane-associated phospholipid phosphatase